MPVPPTTPNRPIRPNAAATPEHFVLPAAVMPIPPRPPLQTPTRQTERRVYASPQTPARPAAAAVASPAHPTLVTPPRADIQSFGFFDSNGKTQGYTPGKNNLIALARYEGKSHLYIRQSNAPRILFSSDTDLTEEHIAIEQAQYLHLYVQLKALKHRADTDSHIWKKNGAIDEAHYHAALVKIGRTISNLVNYISTYTGDIATCLANLNAAISQKTIYNPFGLKRRYGSQESDYLENETSCLSAITPEQLGLSLNLEVFSNLKKQTDKDYSIVKNYGNIAPMHYAAAKRAIQHCINILKINAFSPQIERFLTILNQKIKNNELYNPFGLQRIYEGAHYNRALANKVATFSQPINLAHLIEFSSIEAEPDLKVEAPTPS